MNRVPPVVAAFTLIEMMIAVTLGIMIVFVATSGFRTASQTVTAANRLSLENSILRSGYFEAQIQLDFWTNLDDPTLPDAERPLKSPTLSVGQITDHTRLCGSPFTPMTELASRGIWPSSATPGKNPRFSPAALPNIGPNTGGLGNFVMPRPTNTFADDTWETDRGWDPSYYWGPHDPRTWCRANLAEKDRGNDGRGNDGIDNFPRVINGRYGIFGNTSPTGSSHLRDYILKPDLNNPDRSQQNITQTVSYTGYTTTANSWYYNQLNSLVNAMGYAAFCDYLPANAIYTWYSDQSADVTFGGINKYGVTPDYNFTNGDGGQRNSRGIYRNTYSVSFGYVNPRSYDDWSSASTTPLSGNNLRQKFYQHYNSDYNATDQGGANELRWFLRHINFPEPLLVQRPTYWPDVNVSVGRLIKNAHFVSVAKVRRFAPLTGEVIELSWCGIGTTLRGARQQRNRATGWARWDNASSSTIDPNLDTP